MRIKVTIDDIAEGRKDSVDLCPMALALARAFGVGFNRVRVFAASVTLYLGYRGQVVKRALPARAAAWVEAWGSGGRVSPTEFVF